MFNECEDFLEEVAVADRKSEKNEYKENKESMNDTEQIGRYKLFYDKKLSKHEREQLKDKTLNFYEATDAERESDLKTPEFSGELDKTNERIINFGKKCGLDLRNRLIPNDNIYLLPEDVYEVPDKESFTTEPWAYFNFYNEIVVKDSGNLELNKHRSQHELLHSACLQHIQYKKEGRLCTTESVRGGYQNDTDSSFTSLNEGLTEITNQQIYFENNDFAPTTGNIYEVVFVTELIKDISGKTKIPAEKILTHLQTGMFESELGYLKVIEDKYGKEAMDKLAKMSGELGGKDGLLETARIFKLNSATEKLKNLDKGERIEVNIGKYKYRPRKVPEPAKRVN